MSGYGVMKYQKGSRYEGNWKKGKKEGSGKETFKNGSTFEGEFKDNQRHGQGTLRHIDWEYYEG